MEIHQKPGGKNNTFLKKNNPSIKNKLLCEAINFKCLIYKMSQTSTKEIEINPINIVAFVFSKKIKVAIHFRKLFINLYSAKSYTQTNRHAIKG